MSNRDTEAAADRGKEGKKGKKGRDGMVEQRVCRGRVNERGRGRGGVLDGEREKGKEGRKA